MKKLLKKIGFWFEMNGKIWLRNGASDIAIGFDLSVFDKSMLINRFDKFLVLEEYKINIDETEFLQNLIDAKNSAANENNMLNQEQIEFLRKDTNLKKIEYISKYFYQKFLVFKMSSNEMYYAVNKGNTIHVLLVTTKCIDNEIKQSR